MKINPKEKEVSSYERYFYSKSIQINIVRRSFLFILLFLSLNSVAQTLEIQVSANKTDIFTCETLTYTLKYKCASTTTNCSNVTMTASAPSGIIFPYQTIGLTSDIASYNIASDGRSITFVFKDPLTAGNTGIIEITGMGECGKPNGTVGTLTGSIQSGSGSPVTASVNTTLHSTYKLCPSKSGQTNIAVGAPTIYTIDVKFAGDYGLNGIGATSAGPVTVIDNLPTGAVINSVTATMVDGSSPLPTLPTNACSFSGNTITCNFPSNIFEVIGRWAPRVLIKADVTFPSSSFSVGSTVTNSVQVTYQPTGSAPITVTNGATVNFYNSWNYDPNATQSTCTATLDVTNTLETPAPALSLRKTNDSRVQPGSSGIYTFEAINTGNTPLTAVAVEDAIPTGINVYQINGAQPYNLTGAETFTYWIKTDANPTYTQISLADQYSSYTVPSGVRVTHIKVQVSSVPAGGGFQYMAVRYKAAIDIPLGTSTNCLTATTSTPNAVIGGANACVTTPVVPLDNFSSLQVNKWLTSNPNSQYASFYEGTQTIGTTAWSTMYFQNYGGGQPLQNPVLMDLLPIGLTYMNEVQYGTSSCNYGPADKTEVIPNYNGSGRTLVRLSWNTPMPADCGSWVSLKTQVNSLGTSGTAALYTNEQKNYGGVNAYLNLKGAKNEAFFTGSSSAKCFKDNYYIAQEFYQASDIYDLDEDSKTSIDTLCYGGAYIGIATQAQLSSIKWVKGQCDTTYTKYPNYGKTMPGGLANYKLIVSNTGNVPATSIEVLDMLPYIGDIGVIDPQARLTQWRPNLVTPLNTPTGITVYYTTVQNPCRTSYVAGGPSGCNPPNWTTVLPSDPTTVQGLKFDFGTKVLNPGDEIELSWDMRAPANAPTNGEIAWNSFAYKAVRADNNDPFLPAEPNKVGIQLKPIVPGAYGNRVWLDTNKNGIQDVGETGVDGVRVELHKDNGDNVADPKNDPMVNYTSTANGGLYLFPNLTSGNYYAVFFVPSGYSTTTPNVVTPLDSLDSDGILTTYNGQRVTVTEITTIDANETDLRWDQGIFPDKAALGNYVWFDQNQNNIQDESTTNGVNGIIVSLYRDTNNNGTAEPDGADGAPIAKDTTSNDIYGRPGYYLFENLDAGHYFVKFNLSVGQTFTPNTGTTNGSSDATDSDPATSGVTEVTQLTAGEVDLSWDAGIIITTGPYNLGNLVWSDNNNNGIVDVGENGINGVTVVLFEDRNNNNIPDADEYLTTTYTSTVGGIAGTYNFTQLPAGNYIVQISDANFSSNLLDFKSSTGNDPAPDPDDNAENDDNGTALAGYGVISKPITLGNSAEPTDGGFTNNTVDFGFYKCNKPDYTASVTQPTCSGGLGKITLGTGTVGDKVGYSVGSTYTGPAYSSATAISSLTNNIVVGNIAASSSDVVYTIRIFNGENACYIDYTYTILALNCCTPPTNVTATSNSPVLIGGTINLSASSTGGTSYSWSGPNGFTSTAQNPTITSATTATAGTYTVTVLSSGTCTATATVSVSVNCTPPTNVTATSNSPVNETSTINLSASSTGGTSYSWSGPNGFTSTAQNPTITSATTTTAGTYTVTVLSSGTCTATATVSVIINPVCTKPDAGADVSICSPTSIAKLTAITSGGTWTPITSGNPATASIDASGNVTGLSVNGTYKFIYSVTSGGQTCRDTAQVIRNAQPIVGLTDNSICPNQTLTFGFQTQTGLSFLWSTGATTSTISVSPTVTSTYTVTVTSNATGCSAKDTVVITVNPKPNAGADIVSCQSTAKITAAPSGQSWSFLSFNDPSNPTSTDAASIDAQGNISGMDLAGYYRFLLTDITTQCKDTIRVQRRILTLPQINLNPICEGGTVTFGYTNTTDFTYLWDTGATTAQITVSPIITTDYKVVVTETATGCTAQDTTTVIVKPKPVITLGGSNYLCGALTYTVSITVPAGSTVTSNAGVISGSGTTYSVKVGSDTTSFTISASLNGCNGQLLVNRPTCTPCVIDAGLNQNICSPLSTATLLGTPTGGTWSAQAGNPANASVTNAGAVSGMTSAGTYKFIYTITDVNGTCRDTVSVIVISKPNAGINQTLACSITGIAPTTATVSGTPTGGTWSAQAGNPSNASITNSGDISGMSVSGTYNFIYLVVTSGQTCSDTVQITVPTCVPVCTPPTNVVTSSNSPVLIGGTINLSSSSTGGTSYSWSGPNGFTSAVQNPTISNATTAMAGTYTVTILSSGTCTATATVSVAVNCTPPTNVVASSNSPVIEGGSINLSSSSTGGTSYSWSGPNGFASTIQNPILAPATTAMSGIYTVVVLSGSTCSATATTAVIVNPATTPPFDLSLYKFVNGNKCKYAIGDTVTFTIVVKRQDTQTGSATGISVRDSLSSYLKFVSATTTKGTFSSTSGLWNGISLAVSDSAVLELKAKILNVTGNFGGLMCNEAWIQSMNGTDIDSQVGNKIETEDDFARACVSVPIRICQQRNEKVEISAPAGYTSYQWYDSAGQPISGATSQTYMVTTAGSYSVKVNGNSCPSNTCCPIYVEDFCDCPPQICVPFEIKKTKSAK